VLLVRDLQSSMNVAVHTPLRYAARTIELHLERRFESQAAALERLIMVLGLALGAYPVYHRVVHATEVLAARSLATPWDRALPLVPGWGYVYHFVGFAALLPVLVIKDRRLFRHVGLAGLLVELTTFAFFVAFPVKMQRPPLGAASSFTEWGLQLLYWADSAYGSFPSLHVSLATLAALCCLSVDVWIGALSALIAIAIAMSTLLVKQHYLLDVASGAALGSLAWAAIVVPARTRCLEPPSALRYPRARVLFAFAAYAVLVGMLYAAYLAHWQPWS
jgi:membrane-associated phospholipid phosphatase